MATLVALRCTDEFARWLRGLRDLMIILLAGADKATHENDIRTAIDLARNYKVDD